MMRAVEFRMRSGFSFLLFATLLFALRADGADLTFTLDSGTGSGSATNLPPDADPPCIAPNCVLFTGTLTDSDTDLSFLLVQSIAVSFSASNPSTSALSPDNTFLFDVPGVLSGDPNYATDNSGNPANQYAGPIFGIDIAPGTPVGTYSGTITINAAGGTNDPGQNGFTVTRNFTITVGSTGVTPQTITFGALNTQSFGAAPFPLSATASSGLAVTFTSNTASVCTVSGSNVTLIATGTCAISATQPGNATFSAASPVTQTFVVNPGAQTITFAAIPAVTLPAPPFTLSASASSGLSVAFASTIPGTCTVSASVLTPLAAGTCSVTATQAGNTNYLAAPPVIQSFTINPATGGGGGGGGGGGNPLSVAPASVTITVPVNGAPGTQTVTLTYQTFTQGAPSFSSNFNTNQGNGWIGVSPGSGSMTQASLTNFLYTYTAAVTVSADPTGISAGNTYTGTVNFAAGNGLVSVPVTLNITGPPVPQPTGGIANAASANQATPSVVSPGSYVAIYGTALAGSGNPSATSLPLPIALNGAQVSLGGLPMPLLYASPTQINALIPQSLTPNTSYPLVVTLGSTQSAPVQLTVTEFQPGIYTLNELGSGQGIVTDAFTGLLTDPSHPAHVADYLVVYCTGLGTLQGSNGQQPPADGAVAPVSPLFHTAAQVTATIGGVNAPVSYAGLTPTLAGLYQVNVQVPQGLTPGSAVPVVITTVDPNNGATSKSNSVTIAVQ